MYKELSIQLFKVVEVFPRQHLNKVIALELLNPSPGKICEQAPRFRPLLEKVFSGVIGAEPLYIFGEFISNVSLL